MTAHRKKPQQPRSVTGTVKASLIIVLIGVVVRLIYDTSLSDSVFFDNYILDGLVLYKWALSILDGQTVQLPFFRAPLYPYLLAASYALGGVSQWSIVIIQQLFGVITALVVYRFACDLFDSSTALAAGIIAAVYPTLIFFEGTVMITATSVLLYTLTFWLTFRALSDNSPIKYFFAGIVFGLAAITRPTILPLMLVVAIALIWLVKPKRAADRWKFLIIYIAASACAILPVTITNFVGSGELVLISSQGGVNFYIGNSEKADGISVTAPGPITKGGPYEDNVWTSSVEEAEKRVGHELSQSEVSSYWMGQALDQIAADPMHEIKLLAKKFYYFWHGQEIFNNMSPYYAGEYSVLMALMLWHKIINFPTGLLIPLALIGMVLGVRANRKALIPILFVFVYSLVITLFFVCSRFRQPVLPLIIIFAAYASVQLVRGYKSHAPSFWRWSAGLLALVVVFNLGGDIESIQNRSQFESFLGTAYRNRDDSKSAVEHLKVARDLDPQNVNVYKNLGYAYFELGNYPAAINTFHQGISLFAKNSDMLFGLASSYQAAGQTDSAKLWYTITTQQIPDFPPAYDRLGYLYVSEGNIDSALTVYRKLIKLVPDNAQLYDYIKQLENYTPPADSSQTSQ